MTTRTLRQTTAPSVHRARHRAPAPPWRATPRTAALSLAGLLVVAFGLAVLVSAFVEPHMIPTVLKTWGQ